jgi:hypothetical protein
MKQHFTLSINEIVIVILFNIISALSGYISDMNYSRQESHNQDTGPYSFTPT